MTLSSSDKAMHLRSLGALLLPGTHSGARCPGLKAIKTSRGNPGPNATRNAAQGGQP
jgi:hypothetical protein